MNPQGEHRSVLKRNILVLSSVLLAAAVVIGTVIFVLFGERHGISFLFGVFTAGVNTVLLFIFVQGMFFPREKKSRKGLIFLVVIKYLLLFTALAVAVNYWRLPPLTMVIGLFMIFPAAIVLYWTTMRGQT